MRRAAVREGLSRLGYTVAYRAMRLRWRVLRPRTVGVRVLVAREGRILLVRHSYRAGWFMPGGSLGRGEGLAAAARREVREEVGLDAGPLRLLGIYLDVADGKSDHMAIFVAEQATGAGKATGGEIAEARWFGFDALPADAAPGTDRRLAEYRDGVPPDARPW